MRGWLVVAFILGAAGGVAYAKYMILPTFEADFIVRSDPFKPLPGIPDESVTAVAELEQTFKAKEVLNGVKEDIGWNDPAKILGLLARTSSDPVDGTVMVITAYHDAEGTKAFAESLIARVREHRQGKREEEISSAMGHVESRIEAQEGEVERAQEALRDFREKHGISELPTDTKDGMMGAADLQAERDITEATVKSLEARIQQLKEEVKRSPALEVVTASVSSPDQDRLSSLQAELSEARGSLSDEHPRVKALELQIATLSRRIKSGQSSSVSSSTMATGASRSLAKASLADAQASLTTARGQLASLTKRAEEAQSKMRRFSQVEGEAIALMTQVKVAETLLTTLEEDRAKLSDALRHPEAGFSLVQAPALPEEPVGAKRKLIVAVGAPVGLMLVVLLVGLKREFKDGAVMTPHELGYWGRGPVLASSTWPRDPTALDELVADFDDCAQMPHGDTLLVGSTESVLVETGLLARRLHEEWYERGVVADPVTRDRVPRARALASGDGPNAGATTIELWSRTPDNEWDAGQVLSKNYTGGRAGHSEHSPSSHAPPGATQGRVVAWTGGMEGHALRRAARLAERVVVVVEAGAMNPLMLKDLRTAIARGTGVGYILVSASEQTVQGRDRIGPVQEFWQIAAT